MHGASHSAVSTNLHWDHVADSFDRFLRTKQEWESLPTDDRTHVTTKCVPRESLQPINQRYCRSGIDLAALETPAVADFDETGDQGALRSR